MYNAPALITFICVLCSLPIFDGPQLYQRHGILGDPKNSKAINFRRWQPIVSTKVEVNWEMFFKVSNCHTLTIIINITDSNQ